MVSSTSCSNNHSNDRSSEIRVTIEKKNEDNKNINTEEETSQDKASVRSQPILQSRKQTFKSININLISPHDTKTDDTHINGYRKYDTHEDHGSTDNQINNDDKDDLQEEDYITLDYTGDTSEDDLK